MAIAPPQPRRHWSACTSVCFMSVRLSEADCRLGSYVWHATACTSSSMSDLTLLGRRQGRWYPRMRSSVGRQSVFIGRRRCDARTPAEESAETGAKFVVHPAVDEWIVTAVTHGQPVTQCPHGLNVSVVTHTQTRGLLSCIIPGRDIRWQMCKRRTKSELVERHHYTWTQIRTQAYMRSCQKSMLLYWVFFITITSSVGDWVCQ